VNKLQYGQLMVQVGFVGSTLISLRIRASCKNFFTMWHRKHGSTSL